MLARLKVRRYQPETGQEPYYQSFEVDVPEGATVLDALLEVRDYLDGTLTLRASCRSSICGSCGMRINGVSRLACKTHVVDVAPRGQEITIEPLANLPVIKDLVADMEPFWRKWREVTPWLVTNEEKEKPAREHLMSNKLAIYLNQFAGCIACGVCYSACPIVAIDDDYLGPAALAKALRYSYDPRDNGKRQRLARLAEEQGLWRCHTIFSCAEQCPKRVNPTEAIQQLKKMVILARLGLAR